MKKVRYFLNTPLKKYYKIALLSDLHSMLDKQTIPALRELKPSFRCIVCDLCNTSLKRMML